jgi:NodT family efflux transporter outer membrane factor (OMF) lipoprotein
VDLAHWWRSLNDTELDSLIDRSIQSNLDLQIALTRLQESRATEFVVSGGTLPYLEGSGAAARGSGNNSVKGRIAPQLNAASSTAGLKEITEVIGFDSGWEIDLFGRFRRQLEAVAADTQAAAENRNALLITIVSEVARDYFEMRAAQMRLDIARQNIAVAQQTLNVVQQRFDRGLTNELDVALAQRQTASEQADIAPLEEEVTQAQRRLAVLLDLSPDTLRSELSTTVALPDLPAQVAAGLPVELLRRRPDIRQAERRLAAENARIGVATADLYPRIAVTAGLGLEGQGLGRNPTVQSMIWSVGPTAVVPILDFGRIDSMIMLEEFRTRELFYNYQRTVLGAVEEVDNSVNGYAAQRDRLEQLGKALEASKRAVDLASGRYDRGLIDFLNVLDAQRQLFNLQDQYTVAQQAEVVQYISLYKALGGGWENYQDIPPIRNPLPAVIAAGVQAIHKPSPITETPPPKASKN